MRKFFKLGIPAVVALVLLVTACGGSDPTAVPQATSTPRPAATATPVPAPTDTPAPVSKMGGTLKYVPLADQLGLDVGFSSYYQTIQHSMQINDFLFSFDADLAVQPQMVDTWDLSADGTVYTFNLRDGLAFHDGRPVLAEHIVQTMQRGIAVDTYGRFLNPLVASIDAIDADTLTLTLTEPLGFTLNVLAYASTRFALAMPPEYTSLPRSEQAAGEIGSGPWRFVEWRPGDQIDYVRNDQYVPRDEPASGYAGGKRVFLDAVEWHIIPDSGTKVAAVETGQVDFLVWPPPDSFARTAANDDLVTVRDTAGPVAFIYVNKLVPPFNDIRARKALQAAVGQREHLLTAYPEDLASPCAAVFGCSAAPWTSDVGIEPWIIESDMELAQELWDQAYNGEKLVLVQWTGRPEYQNPGLLTKQILEDLGAEVELFTTDTAAGSALVRNLPASEAGDWHVGHLVSTNYVDPISTTLLNPSFGYGGWTVGDRITELKNEFLKANDDAGRRAAVEEIQVLTYQDAEGIITGQGFRHKVYRKDVMGVIPVPILTYQPMWNIWLDR